MKVPLNRGSSIGCFDLFLDTLLRGLPVRIPAEHPHPLGDACGNP
ncbi:hypothetical protein [Streptomyces scabichelini]|nr:hypothetical protein [Streptomyces scabichelini]